MVKEKTVEIQKEIFKEGGKLGKYEDLILGERGLFKLFKYELIIGLSSWIPGALGLVLRSMLYPRVLGRAGRNVTFGMGVVLRHPKKIFIGDNVVIDDHCVLDAKGADNRGIFIGDGVFLGRHTILNCKNGDIILEDNVNISSNCMIFSASEVRVGADNLMAAYSYLVGGTHRFDDPTIPVLHQKRSSQGIVVGSGGWLGAHVTVFDGVHIGKNVVIGAGSTVNKNIPDYTVAAGVPIKMIKKRQVPEAASRTKKSVTIGVINYNGEKVLGETLDSVYLQDYQAVKEILFVDNFSTDDSVGLVRRKYPRVSILTMESNRGPNPARNIAIREARSELVLLIDSDVVLSPDVVTLLEDALYRYPQAGLASAQIRFYEKPEEIQYNGCHIHFVGGAISNLLDLEKPEVVGAVSAGAVLVDRRKALGIGMYDEDFIFGWEDGDFAFRMTLAGNPCLAVSKARVFHRMEKKGIRWVKYQVRNRWWFILKNYNLRTILVTLPAILIYQLAILCFFTLKGQLKEFLAGSFSVIGDLPSVLRKRREIMKIKKVNDRQILRGKGIDLMGDAGESKLVRMASKMLNLFFTGYWIVARWLVN
jgi:GT2 family glycosyltransferase/acetyltransferase-like isoleucine patch superfamily enzyme